MNTNLANILKLLLSLGLGALIVWVTISKLDDRQTEIVKGVFGRADYFWVIAGPVIGMLSNVVRALRWQMLLRSVGYDPKFSNVNYSVFVMYAGNLLFPRLGEVTRCSLLYKTDNVPVDKSIGTMVLERMVDMITMLLVGGLLFVFQYRLLFEFFQTQVLGNYSKNWDGMSAWTLAIAISGILVSAVSFYAIYTFRDHRYLRGIWKFVSGFVEGLVAVRKLDRPFLFVFYSVLIWVMYFGMIFLCFRALPETASLQVGAGMACLFFGGFAFIVSQGGIGAYPATIGAVLLLYGVAYEVGFAFGWLVWSLQTAAVILCGVLSLLLISRNFNVSSEIKK
ncbi:MAG: lysylphosphatidylglycerol synthase transmembrane domain-containing protein [Chitinophagales bacterium]